jgi:hypothetical protein
MMPSPFACYFFLLGNTFKPKFCAYIFYLKRSLSSFKFIYQNSQGPKVYTFVIAHLKDHLGCVIQSSTRMGLAEFTILVDQFGEAEITELCITVAKYQDVLDFQIPIEDVLSMQVL